MNIKEIHSVYFVGIGGIGMSALAKYFKHIGKEVAGYDKTETALTRDMVSKGIAIHYDDAVANIGTPFLDKKHTLVVYTPAVPVNNLEYSYLKDNDFVIKKRAEVLGIITKESYCLAVAGTHGKTTTSAILAHILKENNVSFTAFLGGISEDFDSNFYYGGKEFTVVEADEYDRSFLQLSPDVACINSMDADHLDIYGEKEGLTTAFEEFKSKISPDGKLFVKSDLAITGDATFGINDSADYYIKNIKVEDGGYRFSIGTPKKQIDGVRFNKPGQHNLLNGLAAFTMALEAGVSEDNASLALASFKGVQRRFSYQVKKENLVYIDDYAHHPTELRAMYNAVRELYPNDKVLAIFQPHLFSRTKDFVDEFAEVLSDFDEVALLAIYPAREKPVAGVSSEWLLEKMNNANKKLIKKEDLVAVVSNTTAKIILTMGAGDIGVEVKKIKEVLLEKN